MSGDLDADFGFTGDYFHKASGLNLTLYRAYDPNIGRWLSRDPLAERGGLNLYAYVQGDPINRIDPNGLADSLTPIGDPNQASCAQLKMRLQEIDNALQNRIDTATTDPSSLWTTAYDTPNPAYPGKGTWLGHVQQYQNIMRHRSKIENLIKKKCKDDCDGDPPPAPGPYPERPANWQNQTNAEYSQPFTLGTLIGAPGSFPEPVPVFDF